MATYVFKCQQCDNEYEEIRKIEQRDQVSQCPACGSTNTKRQVISPDFHMRGRNFGDRVRVR